MKTLIKKGFFLNLAFCVLMLFVLPLISWQQKEKTTPRVIINQEEIESLSSRLVKSKTYREIEAATKKMVTEVVNERIRQGKPKLKISQSKVDELSKDKNLSNKQKRDELAKMGVVVSDEYMKLSTETVPKLYDKLYSEFPELKKLPEDTKQAVFNQSRILYNKISFN